MALTLFVLSAFGAAAAAASTGGMDIMSDFQGIKYNNFHDWYGEVGRPVGMPMGGIGAGSIEISSAGTLMEFGNLNKCVSRLPSIPGTGLAVTSTAGDKTQVFPLSGGKVRFEGNFPFAKLTFPDLPVHVPVDVTLWAWSPFVLHDVRRSAYPVAIFDAQFKNKGSEKAEVGLVLSYGTDYGDWLRESLWTLKDFQHDVYAQETPKAAGQGKDTEDQVMNAPMRVQSKSAPYTGSSVAGITFSARGEIEKAAFAAQSEAQRKSLGEAYLRAYDFTPLDISSVCNRALKQPFGQDANKQIDFGDLKTGRIECYGVPFEILNDSATGGKSLAMVSMWKGMSPRVTLPVHRKADCLFFLGNVSMWSGSSITAQYTVHYADGTKKIVVLRPGFEIGDLDGARPAFCPVQIKGKSRDGRPTAVNLYAVLTDPDKEIQSVDLTQFGNSSPMVFAVTAGKLSKAQLPEDVLTKRRADVERMAEDRGPYKLLSNTDVGYALVARGATGGKVLTYTAASPEALTASLENGESDGKGGGSVYAVEQRFSLAPGQSALAGLVCSWYAPKHDDLKGRSFPPKYVQWFKNASEVAEEVGRDHDKLLTATKRHYDIIATSTLPKWYREMLQSNFYLMPASTWFTTNDIVQTYETTDAGWMATIDIRHYGRFSQFAAFPELDALVLSQFARSQQPSGFIPHDVGHSIGLSDYYIVPAEVAKYTGPSKNRQDYKDYWGDLPIKFCLQVASNYQWTGDKPFLTRMWPYVKRAIAWVQAMDEDNDGIPEFDFGYDGWKMRDKCSYIAIQWAAMLPVVARLAEDLGEPQYAAEMLAIHKKTLTAIQKHLWTGSYYMQSVCPGGKGLDWVSVLQVSGDWFADMLGFDAGLPKDQIRTTLKTMDKVLGTSTKYGLTNALRPDGSSTGSGSADFQCVGWQYFYAAHAMYEGLDDIALRIADEAWRQFTVEEGRIPWCQDEVISNPRSGACTYNLLRSSRVGSTMLMAHSAAGLQIDVPRGTAAIKPANWIWADGRFVLPVLAPKWLGQVKYDREEGVETYRITNQESPWKLNSLRLRTQFTGQVTISADAANRTGDVGADGTVDIGPVTLGDKPLLVTIRR